ncbi:hypothetical protein [Caldalkalibacillus mannanilyticus]|uniref:hypothetical protein n=1 Tax=Caldalkalibacillus mannanilyticus TaxID=1418 RepID=UPI000469AC49|nr:hypothetical protein [Caldalkalibacillus mannanilyticus]
MAIVVMHVKSKRKYVLLGTGFGAYKSTRPSVLGGSLFPFEDMGEIPVAAVSDSKGKIHWFLTEELQVMEIEGRKPEDLIAEEIESDTRIVPDSNEVEYCSACQFKVSPHERECPSCELVLVYEEK